MVNSLDWPEIITSNNLYIRWPSGKMLLGSAIGDGADAGDGACGLGVNISGGW